MSERTPEEILKDIDGCEADINKDLDVLPTRLRPSHEVAAREARERLPVLRAEYRARILANSLAIFTVGGKPGAAEQFAEVASKEGPMVVDANELYQGLAEKIEPAIGRTREFVIDHLLILHREMLKVRSEAGYTPALELPTLAAVETVPDKSALAAYIRKLVNAAGAKNLNSLYVANKMVARAIETRFSKKTFAVVVINSGEEDRAELGGAFARTATADLNTDQEINKSFVIATFKAARKRETNN